MFRWLQLSCDRGFRKSPDIPACTSSNSGLTPKQNRETLCKYIQWQSEYFTVFVLCSTLMYLYSAALCSTFTLKYLYSAVFVLLTYLHSAVFVLWSTLQYLYSALSLLCCICIIQYLYSTVFVLCCTLQYLYCTMKTWMKRCVSPFRSRFIDGPFRRTNQDNLSVWHHCCLCCDAFRCTLYSRCSVKILFYLFGLFCHLYFFHFDLWPLCCLMWTGFM